MASESNRTEITFVKETTFGTTPSSAVAGYLVDYSIPTNYQVDDGSNALAIGDTSVTVKTGTVLIPLGTAFMFAGDNTTYTVTKALTGAGTLEFTPGLIADPGNNAAITFTLIGATQIPVDTGTVAIPKGAHITFAGHTTIYRVTKAQTGEGTLEFTPGLTAAPSNDAAITITVYSMKIKEFTSEDLMYEKNTERSQRVRADAQVPDWLLLNTSARGNLNDELGYTSSQPFIQAALRTTEETSAVTGTNTMTATGTVQQASYDYSGTGKIQRGQWVKLTDKTTSSQSGVYLVESVATGMVNLADISGFTASTDADLAGKWMINGTTQQSFTMQKNQQDVTGSFQRFTGMRVNTWSLQAQAAQICQSNYGFMGLGMATATSDLNSDPTAADAESPMTASAHIEDIKLNYDALPSDYDIQGINLETTNNMRNPAVIGQAEPSFVNAGSFEVTGQLSVFYARLDDVDDFVNHDDFALSWLFEDADGNFFGIHLPKVYTMSDGTPASGGLNQDIVVNYRIGAALSPVVTTAGSANTRSHTMVVSRIDA